MKANRGKERLFKKYSIVVSCFSRADLLEKCLNSIINAKSFEKYNLIVLHQVGFQDVNCILDKFADDIDVKMVVNSQLKNPLENINWNRLATYKIAFELFDSEFTLGVEEDVEISSDALKFLIEVHNQYKNSKMYRGVNLGSYSLDGNTNEFNRLRYGIHGQAGAISQKTWKSLPIQTIEKRIEKFPLDGMLESFLKTGFMITPLRSKYLDRGWNGTHAPKDPNNEHYIQLMKSFKDSQPVTYVESIVSPNPEWRKDCKIYSKRKNLYYWNLYFLNLLGIKFGKVFYLKLSSKLESLLVR